MKNDKAKKTLFCGMFFPVLLSVLVFFFQGCASKSNYETSYVQLMNHFQKNGLKISQIQPLNFYVVGAESAFSFKIGDREIGIYKYNPKLMKHRERMERVDRNGTFYVVGKKFKAVRNGSYIMIDHETHPNRAAIEKAFKSF